MRKYFPYLPGDPEQQQQAAELKEKYSCKKEEYFTLVGETYDGMPLILLSYNDLLSCDEDCELPE